MFATKAVNAAGGDGLLCGNPALLWIQIKLEIAVHEAFVEKAVKAITGGARSGQIGDGKIFVLDLQECIRIRTGERGGEAIG
ncbi:MAG: P-II family nitrogen regulator [Phycisphaerae bacterium]|nr:P-II family nitrogen regulator [Phycisphaerae bacterium]